MVKNESFLKCFGNSQSCFQQYCIWYMPFHQRYVSKLNFFSLCFVNIYICKHLVVFYAQISFCTVTNSILNRDVEKWCHNIVVKIFDIVCSSLHSRYKCKCFLVQYIYTLTGKSAESLFDK